MSIAFLIIDVQKAFVENKKNDEFYSMSIEYINATADLFRKYDKPVVVIQDLEEGDSEEFDFIDELNIHETDIHIKKYFNNSFWQTNLEDKLKALDVDTVILSGNALEYCVIATFFGALERGFKVFLLQKGIIAEYHQSLDLLYLQRPLISYAAIGILLKALQLK